MPELTAWACREQSLPPRASQAHIFIPAEIASRITAAFQAPDLSQCARALLSVLADERVPHIGSAAAIQISALQAHWKALDQPAWTPRAIKAGVKELLEEHGVPVGSSRCGVCGYYLAVSPEDARAATKPLIAEIVSLANRVKRFDSKFTLGAVVAGQTRLGV